METKKSACNKKNSFIDDIMDFAQKHPYLTCGTMFAVFYALCTINYKRGVTRGVRGSIQLMMLSCDEDNVKRFFDTCAKL